MSPELQSTLVSCNSVNSLFWVNCNFKEWPDLPRARLGTLPPPTSYLMFVSWFTLLEVATALPLEMPRHFCGPRPRSRT